MRSSNLASLLGALPGTFAVPQQPELTNPTTLPTHFGLVVFSRFQALDVFGPMDILNSLYILYSNSTKMHLSILSKTLDPVSTPMPATLGAGNFSQSIVPTITFQDYLAKERLSDGPMPHGSTPGAKGDIEVLFVPGGPGTRDDMTEEIAFVKAVYPKLKYIVSVCTGATILSRAGILDGRKATTNKASWKWATSTGPNVTWVPTARWVEDGNIISSSGVAAGIDATFAWVGKVYGEEVADYVAKAIEHPRETDAHHDPFGKIWDVPGAT